MHAAVTSTGPTEPLRHQSRWVHHPNGPAPHSAPQGTAYRRSDAPLAGLPLSAVPPLPESPVFEPQPRPLRIERQAARPLPTARPARRQRLDPPVVMAALVMAALAVGVVVGIATL